VWWGWGAGGPRAAPGGGGAPLPMGVSLVPHQSWSRF